MPNRIIREGILTSERVDRIADEPAVEVFYRRLLSVVDDFGLFSARSSLLRAALYPMRLDKVSDAEMASHIESCVAAGLVRLYEADGKPYLQLLDFKQRTRATKSRFPLPPDGQAAISSHGNGWQIAEIRRTDDGQSPVMRQNHVGRPQAETETETESEARDGLPVDQFFEERYKRHPKKLDRVLAEQAMEWWRRVSCRQGILAGRRECRPAGLSIWVWRRAIYWL